MAPALSPNLMLTMGDIERKVDMSLDDIIKMSKQKKSRRAPIKSRNRALGGQARRDALQRSVAFRSSAIRQGKLADARARNGNAKFLATKAAARRAMSTSVNPTGNWRSRKAMQATPRPLAVTAKNIKRSVPNRVIKNATNRRPVTTWANAVGNGSLAPPRRPNWGPNKMMVIPGPVRKPQTLDSRFASLREERQLQSQYGPQVVWRR